LAPERLRHLVGAALLVPLGVLTKLYSGPLAQWVANSAGGLLYVVFWVLLARGLFPRLRPAPVAAAVFCVTSTLEFLQLWHPPLLTRVRSTFLGHALLGSTFAWSDFAYYAAGCVAAWALSRRLGRRPGDPAT
jgi:hypothetical protein